MATPREKAQCVSWFIETESNLQTQRNFRTKYERDPPVTFINSCMTREIYGDSVRKERSERPRTSEENIDRVRNRVPS